jgi:integrase
MTKLSHLDEDKRITIYPREYKQGTIWYGRFLVEKRELINGQRYLRESLKTQDEEIAKHRAIKRYAEITVFQNNDFIIKNISVGEGIKKFMADFESKMQEGLNGYSPSMFRLYRKHVVNYWSRYIGHRNLSTLTNNDFRNYEGWRRKNVIHKNNTVSNATLKQDITLMKSIVRWCLENNLHTGTPISYVFKMGVKNRRSAFTLQQYRRIILYMRTKEFLTVGKMGNDSRIIRHRKMLKEYFLFLCNSGLRVGECRQLRWRDVSFEKTDTGKTYVRIRVSRKTKTGQYLKNMERIGRSTASRSLERLKEERDDNLGENDFIFCSPEGKQIGQFRESFAVLLKEASEYIPKSDGVRVDCEYDTDGQKLTPYCCRHTYITFQLRYRKHSDIYVIASNTGTSVSMIEQYYSDARSEDFIDKLI